MLQNVEISVADTVPTAVGSAADVIANATDSLSKLPADSAAMWQNLLYANGDATTEAVPTWGIDHIFGSGSRVVEAAGGMASSADGIMATDIVYQAFVVILFLAYCYMLYAYRNQISQFFDIIRSRYLSEKLSEETTGSLFQSLMRYNLIWCFPACAVMTLKALAMGGSTAGVFAVPAVIAVVGMLYCLQYCLLKGTGALVSDNATTDRLIMLKNIVAGAGFIVITPFILIAALNVSGSEMAIYRIIEILAAVMILIYAQKTLKLFVEQKVSILLWILYLCTVEVMPIVILIVAILDLQAI